MVAKREVKLTVSTRSRPKAAGPSKPRHTLIACSFQHAAARRRLVPRYPQKRPKRIVSTRSRPKAAGPSATVRTSRLLMFQHAAARRRLDLHCSKSLIRHGFQHAAARRRLVWIVCRLMSGYRRFNTQPPEGGWLRRLAFLYRFYDVSTRSRPKAAGTIFTHHPLDGRVSTRSRPKAAG